MFQCLYHFMLYFFYFCKNIFICVSMKHFMLYVKKKKVIRLTFYFKFCFIPFYWCLIMKNILLDYYFKLKKKKSKHFHCILLIVLIEFHLTIHFWILDSAFNYVLFHSVLYTVSMRKWIDDQNDFSPIFKSHRLEHFCFVKLIVVWISNWFAWSIILFVIF